MDAGLRLCIVTVQALGGTMVMDKIFKGLRDLVLRGYGIVSKKVELNASIKLEHGTTTMARDAIIMGRVRAKDCICGEPLH